jgi:hypothetical protein
MRADDEAFEAPVRGQVRLDRRGLSTVLSGAVEQMAHGAEMWRTSAEGLRESGVDGVGALGVEQARQPPCGAAEVATALGERGEPGLAVRQCGMETI